MNENHSGGSRSRSAKKALRENKGKKNSCWELTSEDSDEEPGAKRRKYSSRPIRRRRRFKDKPVYVVTSDSNESNTCTSNEDSAESAEEDEKVIKKDRKFKKGSEKTRRKRLKKILDEDELKDETKEAAKEERERLRRLKKREIEEDNNEIDKSSSHEEQIKGPSLILQKNPQVGVSPSLSCHLRPHQVEGVRFIWNNLIESTDQASIGAGAGCILAHCMGLGKTLQTIACVHTFLKCEHLNFDRALIVAPLNTVRNWIAEFEKWCDPHNSLRLYNFADPKSNKARISMLRQWQKHGGVLVTGYDMYRIMLTKIKFSQWKKTTYECLVDPGPDIVVCDEGHMLKNSESHISKQISKIKTRRRLVLTGTPLQNNLTEYHCMVNFVKPDLLGSLKEFRNRFVNPIINGQHIDSTDRDVKLMKNRSHVLHQILEGFVQRKDYSALKEYLSGKFEYVLKVRLTPLQIKLYRHYLDTMTNRGANTAVVNCYGKGSSLFADYQNLMRVWTHPKSLLLHSVKRGKLLARQLLNDLLTGLHERSESEEWCASSSSEEDSWGKKKKTDSKSQEDKVNINDLSSKKDEEDKASGSEEVTNSRKKTNRKKKRAVIEASSSDSQNGEKSDVSVRSESGQSSDASEDDEEKLPDRHTRASQKSRRYRLRCVESSESEDSSSMGFGDFQKRSSGTEWYSDALPADRGALGDYRNSLKITLLFEIIRLAEERKEKVLVFSQSLISLDLIENMLQFAPTSSLIDDCSENDDVHIKKTRWKKNVDYFRMDGATQGHHRQKWINAFNNENNTRSRLFLISTKAGSLGVNLVGANRVVIFDASWNPSHDTQSMFRVYRFGQKKKCYIYRLIAEGTMEEKIYQRQVNKQSLAFRVVDEQQINRHFTASSLAEMYTFEPSLPSATENEPTPVVPKDDLLAEILLDPRTRHMISSFHEHDSLLDHQVDEELTEEERKAAWEEYELAKATGSEAPTLYQNLRQQPAPDMSRIPGLAGVSLQTMHPLSLTKSLEDLAALIPRLSKVVANAFYQYQVCEVKPVDSIIQHLKETPLYSSSKEETIRAIAVEVNYRLEMQRKEKFTTFQSLQSQLKELQAHYFALIGGGNLVNNQTPAPPVMVPSRADLLKQLAAASSSAVSLLNGRDSMPLAATTTTISEIIELNDDDDDDNSQGTSETVDK